MNLGPDQGKRYNREVMLGEVCILWGQEGPSQQESVQRIL